MATAPRFKIERKRARDKGNPHKGNPRFGSYASLFVVLILCSGCATAAREELRGVYICAIDGGNIGMTFDQNGCWIGMNVKLDADQKNTKASAWLAKNIRYKLIGNTVSFSGGELTEQGRRLGVLGTPYDSHATLLSVGDNGQSLTEKLSDGRTLHFIKISGNKTDQRISSGQVVSIIIFILIVASCFYYWLYSSYRNVEENERRLRQDQELAKERRQREEFDQQVKELIGRFNNDCEQINTRITSCEEAREPSSIRHLALITIICSNGHKYRYSDFEYVAGKETKTTHDTYLKRETVESTTATENKIYNSGDWLPSATVRGTQTSTNEVITPVTYHETSSHLVKKFGCPLCASSLFEFEEKGLRKNFAIHKCIAINLPDAPAPSKGHWETNPNIWMMNKSVDCPFCGLKRELVNGIEALPSYQKYNIFNHAEDGQIGCNSKYISLFE